MCASRSQPHAYAGARPSHDKNPRPAPYHPLYPRYPPCDPYAAYHCHPGAFYPSAPPYYSHHEDTASSWWSWFNVLFFVLLVAGVWIGIVCYRKLSRETRDKIAARLARFLPQVIALVDSAASAPSRSRGALIRPDSAKKRERNAVG